MFCVAIATAPKGRSAYVRFSLFNSKRLEFDSLFGVAVATTPKGRRTAAPPLGTPAAPTQ